MLIDNRISGVVYIAAPHCEGDSIDQYLTIIRNNTQFDDITGRQSWKRCRTALFKTDLRSTADP